MSKLSLNTRVRWAEDVLYRNLSGEAVLLSLASSTYFGLDLVGTRIWELIGEHALLSTVLELIRDEYDVDGAKAREDLLALVDELVARGLVSADDD